MSGVHWGAPLEASLNARKKPPPPAQSRKGPPSLWISARHGAKPVRPSAPAPTGAAGLARHAPGPRRLAHARLPRGGRRRGPLRRGGRRGRVRLGEGASGARRRRSSSFVVLVLLNRRPPRRSSFVIDIVVRPSSAVRRRRLSSSSSALTHAHARSFAVPLHKLVPAPT